MTIQLITAKLATEKQNEESIKIIFIRINILENYSIYIERITLQENRDETQQTSKKKNVEII